MEFCHKGKVGRKGQLQPPQGLCHSHYFAILVIDLTNTKGLGRKIYQMARPAVMSLIWTPSTPNNQWMIYFYCLCPDNSNRFVSRPYFAERESKEHSLSNLPRVRQLASSRTSVRSQISLASETTLLTGCYRTSLSSCVIPPVFHKRELDTTGWRLTQRKPSAVR